MRKITIITMCLAPHFVYAVNNQISYREKNYLTYLSSFIQNQLTEFSDSDISTNDFSSVSIESDISPNSSNTEDELSEPDIFANNFSSPFIESNEPKAQISPEEFQKKMNELEFTEGKEEPKIDVDEFHSTALHAPSLEESHKKILELEKLFEVDVDGNFIDNSEEAQKKRWAFDISHEYGWF